MKIRAKEVTKTVPLLVDPEPGWMALVNHGANQEPFNALKSETGERNGTMGKGKAAKRDSVLTRMNFSKEQFKDEASVQKFLDDNNISGCEIEDEGDVFAAKSTTIGDLELEKAVSTGTKHAGVTAFIAEPKAKADDTTTTDTTIENDTTGKPKEDATSQKTATKAKLVDGKKPTTKADGSTGDDASGDDTDTELRFPANKYDFWGAYMSNEGNLMGVLKDGIDYDGVPPGVDEVVSALYYSTGNILSGSDTLEEKKAKLSQVGEDFAALAGGLYELFNQATEDSTKSANNERKAKAASFVKSFSESVTRATKAGDNVIVQPTETNKATGGGVTVDIADATGETEEDRLNTLIGKAVGAAIAPLTAQLEAANKRADTLETEMSRSTQRRSDQSIIDDLIDDTDEGEPEPSPVAKQAMTDFAGIFGIRPRGNAG